jgi:hypothetical protein
MSPKKRHDHVAEMQPEYDFTGAVRGKYYKRYQDGATVNLLPGSNDDLALMFEDRGPVDAGLLADILFLLRGAYTAGLRASRLGPIARISNVKQRLEVYLRRLTIRVG